MLVQLNQDMQSLLLREVKEAETVSLRDFDTVVDAAERWKVEGGDKLRNKVLGDLKGVVHSIFQ